MNLDAIAWNGGRQMLCALSEMFFFPSLGRHPLGPTRPCDRDGMSSSQYITNSSFSVVSTGGYALSTPSRFKA